MLAGPSSHPLLKTGCLSAFRSQGGEASPTAPKPHITVFIILITLVTACDYFLEGGLRSV